ncbi:MAG: hypothetical protein ABTR07_16460 [Candidatus Competibacter denitrificans]
MCSYIKNDLTETIRPLGANPTERINDSHRPPVEPCHFLHLGNTADPFFDSDSWHFLLKGNGLDLLWGPIWPILLFMAAVLALGLKTFRRTLD